MERYMMVLKSFKRMNLELEQALRENFRLIAIEKGQLLQPPGELNDMLYFIEKGLLHRFTLKNDRRISLQFDLEDEFVITFEKMSGKTVQPESGIEALEASILWCITRKVVEELRNNHERFLIQLAEICIRGILTVENSGLCSDPAGSADNYKNLCLLFPKWLQRVPVEYLADFTNLPEKVLRHLMDSDINLHAGGERKHVRRDR